MTNEEAIKILASKMDGSVDQSYEWVEAIRLAICALNGKENLEKKNKFLVDKFEDLIALKTRVEILESQMSGLVKQTSTENDRLQDMKNLYDYVYPAIFTPEDNGAFSIRFPDIENCFTCGDNIKDGMLMAKDALAFMVYTNYEETGKPAPVSTPINDLKLKKDEFATYIVCNTMECRRKFGTKAVKKTLTIPEWLNEAAIKERINFSRVLQDALIEKLNVL